MRKPYDKLPKKCVIAIMAAATLMSIEAQSTICPMVVYADTPTNTSYDTNTTAKQCHCKCGWYCECF